MSSLTVQEIKRRQKLTDKLKSKNLLRNEAGELRDLLEKEKKQASSTGDVLAVLAIIVLIGLVIAYLSQD